MGYFLCTRMMPSLMIDIKHTPHRAKISMRCMCVLIRWHFPLLLEKLRDGSNATGSYQAHRGIFYLAHFLSTEYKALGLDRLYRV